jgi:hypothetical protein
MALEFQTFTVNLSEPTYTATFSAAVSQYVAGITGFNLSYSDGDANNVQTVQVRLQITSVAADQLAVQVVGQLSDDSGNSVDEDVSWVTVGVIAELAPPSGDILLSNAAGIASGETATVPLAQSPDANFSLLSGFSLSYGSATDHSLGTLNASISVAYLSGEDVISAEAVLNDGGGNSAAAATVDGGVLATLTANAGIVTTLKTGLQSNTSVLVDMAPVIPQNYKLSGDVVALLTAYQISYGGNSSHQVNSIGAGLVGSLTRIDNNVYTLGARPMVVEGVKVLLPSPLAYTYNQPEDNDPQDDGKSGIDILIVAGIVPT